MPLSESAEDRTELTFGEIRGRTDVAARRRMALYVYGHRKVFA